MSIIDQQLTMLTIDTHRCLVEGSRLIFAPENDALLVLAASF
jgi:hypothetical protein